METYNQHIDLINDYLNDTLSENERIDFESQLNTNSEFNAIYKEHVIFLRGLNRTTLKKEISKAKRSHYTSKWIKISGLILIVVGIIVTLFTLLNPKSDNDPKRQDVIPSVTHESSAPQDSSKTAISKLKETKEKPIERSFTTTTQIAKYGSWSKTEQVTTKKAESFIFHQKSDTVFRCKEGTLLKLSKGSFVNAQTKATINGPVELFVSEYYELSDILLANLSTASNGKLLETGGMIHIEAQQGNTKLALAQDSNMQISFPTSELKESMQLFNGEWNDKNINWVLQNDELESLEITDTEPIVEVPFNVVERAPTFPECDELQDETRRKCTQEIISNFINRNFNTEIGNSLGLTGLHSINVFFKIDIDGSIIFVQSNSRYPQLSEEANRVVESLPKMIPGKQRGRAVIVPYSIPIGLLFEGESSSSEPMQTTDAISIDSLVTGSFREVIMDTIYTESRGVVEMIREVMHDADFIVDSTFIEQWNQYKKQRLIREIDAMNNRRFILRKQLFEMENTRFVILDEDSITRGGHVVRIPWDATKIPTSTRVMQLRPRQLFSAGRDVVTSDEFEARISNGSDQTISTKDLNYYVLKTSNLGWINCDRFINNRAKRIKYKLKIKNTSGAKISMVFKSYNSVLPSWERNGYFDFQMVPDNENVTLIAIKRENGKLYFDQIETTTQENPELIFNFDEITLDELIIRIDRLGETINL